MKVRYLICGIIFALAGTTTAAPLLNIFEGGALRQPILKSRLESMKMTQQAM